MLVLSRRPDQKIVFPSIDVTIKLLKVRGRVAKIGIDAPRELQILREEVSSSQEEKTSPRNPPKSITASDHHELRSQLNAAKMALRLAQRQISKGDSTKAAQTLDTVVDAFVKPTR